MSQVPNIERGDILLIEFDPTRGSEIKKTRPGIVVTNNVANAYSRLLMVVPLTSQKLERVYPHEVLVEKSKGLPKASKAVVSQMRSIDKSRIKSKLGRISPQTMKTIDIALKLHLGLP